MNHSPFQMPYHLNDQYLFIKKLRGIVTVKFNKGAIESEIFKWETIKYNKKVLSKNVTPYDVKVFIKVFRFPVAVFLKTYL